MPMNEQSKNLASKIEQAFLDGTVLSDDACHFLNSTFLNPTLPELEAMVNDAANNDRDCFLELVFFPDEALQVKIEELLAQGSFQPRDADDLADYLARTKPVANVYIPGYQRPVRIQMPGWTAGALVTRLRITKQLDPELAEAVFRYVHEDKQNLVRVRLRNSDVAAHRRKIDFIAAFFKCHSAEQDGFFSYLDFLLRFLAEIDGDVDIAAALRKKRHRCEAMVRQAITFGEQLKKHNMETMMMKGMRNMSINVTDIQEQINLIRYLQNLPSAVSEGADINRTR